MAASEANPGGYPSFDEHRSRNAPRFWLIAIAASAGGIPAIRQILANLPSDLPAAVVLVQHRPPEHGNSLAAVLSRGTSWTVRLASTGEAIEPGQVYLARADRHLTVTPYRIRRGRLRPAA